MKKIFLLGSIFLLSSSILAGEEKNTSICTISYTYDTYCAHNSVRADLSADDPRCLQVSSLLLGYTLSRDNEKIKFYSNYNEAVNAAQKLDERGACIYLD